MLRGQRTFRFTAVVVSRLTLLLYSVMFASLGRQADGLMGPDGISPLCRRPSLAARICAIVALTACFLPVCAMSGLIVALALVWLSVVYRGYMQADFLHFQWDALAMEMGALAAIAALATIPRSDVVQEACAALAMHCFALLGFKLMWGSCLCKLFSNCPEWNFGTAMQHHHRTTCLPKPMARRLHRWSSSFQVSKAQVLATLWVEGPFSLLALLGWPLGRAVCACLWCTLMVTIAASGNYGFFNLQTCVIATALLDDRQFGQSMVSCPTSRNLQTWFLLDGLPWALTFCYWAMYMPATVSSLYRISRAQPPEVCAEAEELLFSRQLACRYGLFASMTTSRDEVVIRELHALPHEVAQQAERDGLASKAHDDKYWVELAFPYKPGPLNRAPPVLLTHMPRLDWQLWFVSLQWEQSSKTPEWFQQFLQCLRERRASVVNLVAHRGQHPVQELVLMQEPKDTRVTFEDYEYCLPSQLAITKTDDGWECGDWWCRRAPIPNLKSVEEPVDEEPAQKESIELDEAPMPSGSRALGAHARLWHHLKHSWGLLQTHVGLISRRSVPDPAILILGLLSTIMALTAVMAFCSAAPVPRPKVETEGKRPVARYPAPTAGELASASRQMHNGPDQGARGERQYPPTGGAGPYSSVSVPAASAASLPPPKRPSHVGGEAGAMFSWSPRSSEEEDTLCPCLVVPEGMEFVFAVREVLADQRQELSFSVVDLEGSPLSHIIVNESGSGPQCGIFLQMLDREPLASIRTDMFFEKPRRLPEICLPSGEVFCSLERDGSREYVLRDQHQQKLLRLQGNFRDKAVKVISKSGQLVALSERCIIDLDGGTHYQVRVAPQTDAGLVLCSLLAVDKIEGGRLR
ncbi:LMF2 [Symbiodinium pilosum]|uniref:Lipase maturation factor 2 n=1 Tax=Symbiodinium pilosum TaxID=2952 RepID=A0A812T5A6_SYMPI|nr:LMF2 [Symbiodinium pilosum]